MGGRHPLRSVGTLNHIKQKSDESLGEFYIRFNRELASIDQVITCRESFVPFTGTAIPVNMVE